MLSWGATFMVSHLTKDMSVPVNPSESSKFHIPLNPPVSSSLSHFNVQGLGSIEECYNIAKIPRDEEGEPLCEDFICQACAAVCSFLTLYPQTIWATVRQGGASLNTGKGKNSLADEPSASASGNLESGIGVHPYPKMELPVTIADSETVSGAKELLPGENTGKNVIIDQCTKESAMSRKCFLDVDLLVAPPALEKNSAMFLSKNWRDILCRCEKCTEFYKQKGIGFLVDMEDSIMEYEKIAKQKREEKLQQQEGVELNFLDNLGHVEKMEILSGIADMKNEIRLFLESFDSSKPITSADVHEVFDNLAKKRKRVL